MQPSPVRLAIWTDRLGYFRTDSIQVYLTMSPMGDTNRYSEFTYLENIERGRRLYLPRLLTDWRFEEDTGMSPGWAPSHSTITGFPTCRPAGSGSGAFPSRANGSSSSNSAARTGPRS